MDGRADTLVDDDGWLVVSFRGWNVNSLSLWCAVVVSSFRCFRCLGRLGFSVLSLRGLRGLGRSVGSLGCLRSLGCAVRCLWCFWCFRSGITLSFRSLRGLWC